MTKWEYKLFAFKFSSAGPQKEVTDKLLTEINDLGRDGWEAVNLDYLDLARRKKKKKTTQGVLILFRRPLPQWPAPAK